MGLLQGARTHILRCLIPCRGKTTPDIRPVARIQATTPPEMSRTEIRDALGKRHHLTEGPRMHVGPTHEVSVACESPGLASPVRPLGL